MLKKLMRDSDAVVLSVRAAGVAVEGPVDV